MAAARIVGALLAAGSGSRFGGNKLEAMLAGTMIGEHAAHALAGCGCDWNVAICRPDAAGLGTALDALGFLRIVNDTPEAGLSHSLGLAAQYAIRCGAEGVLVCLGDMPFVTTAHLEQLLCAFDATNRESCVASLHGAIRMSPAIIPASLFAALATLSGDQGARALLRDAICVATDPALLADIDTRPDLAAHGV
jgi:CTP:molybdopterin cytidylyltransferase MocA